MTRCAYLLVAALLAACGGGGGGGAPATPGNPAATAALSFSPATASTSVEAGKSATVTLGATVNRPNDFSGTVYASVVDSSGVLLPTARIQSVSATEYSAVLQTAATLAPGNYKGSFTVNLCREPACAQHFPGSPMLLPYDFTVTPALVKLSATPAASLSPSMALGGAAPAPVQVSVKGQSLNWTARATAPWLLLENAAGVGDGTFIVRFDASKVTAQGVLNDTITITAGDGQKVELPVLLTVTPPGFVVDQNGLTFNAINGEPIPAQQVKLSLEGFGSSTNWSAATDAGWLSASPLSGTSPGAVTLSVNPARGPLASGQYNARLLLSAPNVAQRALPVQLNLVKPTLTLSPASLTLGGSNGRSVAPQGVSMSLNTGGNSWGWTLSNVPLSISASAYSGAVSQAGGTVNFSPNPAVLPVGTTSAVLNASVKVNGDTVSKPLTIVVNRDQQKLVPSEVGVAFVSAPGATRLSKTITVRDNFGMDTAWSATSSQAWLEVEQTGSQLVLNADPSGLAQDSLHTATVTLSTTAAGVSTPEVIRVALWHGSAAPALSSKIGTRYTRLAADPVRPYAYVHAQGADLDVYNVYTGQKVTTLAALGTTLGDMALSPNGDRLYVFDTTARTILMVNLITMSKFATWSVPNALTAGARMLVVRPNGEEMVLTSERGAYRLATGSRIATSIGGQDLAATRDGRMLFTQDEGYAQASLGAYDVDFSAMANGTLFAARLKAASAVNNSSYGQDLAVSLDGKRLYTAADSPYRCSSIAAADLTAAGSLPGGGAYPNNVEVDVYGRVLCGAQSWYGNTDVWLHDANGALLRSFKFAAYGKGLLARQMQVSGDGLMLLALTDDPALALVWLGP